jgi:hypothetical protein
MPTADHRITLPQALAAEITPNQLGDYLVSQGYRLMLTDARGFAVYERSAAPRTDASGAAIELVESTIEIEIPTNTAHRDYPRRVCEALGDLGEPWPGLLHKINPGAFPVARLLAFVGLPGGELDSGNDASEPGDGDGRDGDGRDLDDVARWPEVPMNVEGQHAGEEGKPIAPYDLDFYDDREWALSLGTPWHADRCKRDYFRHPQPVQTGDCEGAETLPVGLTTFSTTPTTLEPTL